MMFLLLNISVWFGKMTRPNHADNQATRELDSDYTCISSGRIAHPHVTFAEEN